MAKYYISGGKKLVGELPVHGAKNSALPILAAALLSEESILHNCPILSDVSAACKILEHLGCAVKRKSNTITVIPGKDCRYDIPDDLMREMRSSIVFLGAIIARCKKARISMPGGCELGPRPIDLHLAGLKKLGVSITEDHGFLNCEVKDRLRGATISLPFPSVGATENILLAACLAEGTTIIHNAAREPEITDLAGYLQKGGAEIRFENGSTIVIEGVQKLGRISHSVIPDRIVAVTYLCCAAITGGEILLTRAEPQHLSAILPVLEEMGCIVRVANKHIYLKAPGRLLPIKTLRTMPYPGFPTDAQAPVMALAAVADGSSLFVENIFENRYKHVDELTRMGANIQVEGRVAVVEGVQKLHSASVQCTDLRGGAALCIAALAADGVSEITEIRHLERGYQDFDKCMAAIGASFVKEE